MSFIEFAFAFFIFVLVCLVILLYAKMARPSKTRDDAASDKEKRLFKLYQNLEDMMNSIEEYVEEAKKEIAQDKERISSLVDEAARAQKTPVAQEPKPKEEPPAPVKEIKEPPVIIEEPLAAKPIRNMKKNELVLYMKKEGMGDDKIAKELGISRGEVALILGIKK